MTITVRPADARAVRRAEPMLDPVAAALAYREAMSRVAAAVTIVATDGPAGLAGFTATAVASVSDNPPTLLVCVNRESLSAQPLRTNQRFSVNTLNGNHLPLADVFAGRTGLHGMARFDHGAWRHQLGRAPMLADSLAAFQCRIVDVQDVATHMVIIGTVEAVEIGPDHAGLVYWQRAYRTL